MNRRSFLGVTLVSAASTARIQGANDAIRVGIVGFGGRAHDLLTAFSAQPDCRIAAICDIDQGRLNEGVYLARKAGSASPKAFQDIRKLLDDKDVDAVAIATCNHWHALATIWACQAGKDVYVEKPASHNIWEGRRMVEAARKYSRVVQVGMQGRSITHKRQAIEMLHGGVIGKVYMAKGLCFKRRLSIGKKPSGPVPQGVDYDQWLGPAQWREFNPNRFHYNWHWFWDTGNGDIGNQGPHQMDLARWGLGKKELPRNVHSSGSKFLYDDDQETPNTQLAEFSYDDCQVVFEVRGLLTTGEDSITFESGNFIGNLFFGSEGVMALDARGCRVFAGEKRELAKELKLIEAQPDDPAPHVANFLSVARSRKTQELAAGIEEGHLSSAMCHMANVSYRVGRSLVFDPVAETFDGGDANALCSRQYRSPFTVPARV
ncbi:MAG TPA: Gfo/Idh/MocA family oxidoreductase [Bryobacteraceae bacterium]|nr:Gfo/Idh/MocA family oxidoreductase [Bryobacteraceae bacterium]